MSDPTGPDLLDEQMDQRLRDAGARWRDALPEPAPVVPVAARAGRRRLVPAAAAAAVILVLGVTFTVTRGHSDSPQVDPADITTPASPVVPWKALPPTDPKLARGPRDWPTPADIEQASPCRSGELVPDPTPDIGAATGTRYLIVPLSSTASGPCWIDRWPRVTLVRHGVPLDLEVQRSRPGGLVSPAGRVLVAPGHPARLTIGFGSGNVCFDEARVVIGQALAPLTVTGMPTLTCDGLGPGGPPFAFVWPIAQDRGRPTSPYTDVTVSGDLDHPVAGAGPKVTFEVTLTSPVDLSLDPCPDYTVNILIDKRFDTDRYALNCADVSYTDDDGKPYLPARVPVTFAMQTLWDGPAPRIEWTLVAPGRPSLTGNPGRARHDGTVRGTVTLDGGPAPGTSTPVTSGEISFDGEAASAGTSIGPTGSYEVRLPAGDYDVTVTTPDWNGGQTYEAATFRVSGGGTNRLDVRLPVR